MNVGITRASHALWLLGNARTLSINEHWRALMDDARARGCMIEAADAAELFPKAFLWQGPGAAPPARQRNGAARDVQAGTEARAQGPPGHRYDTPPPPPPPRQPAAGVPGLAAPPPDVAAAAQARASGERRGSAAPDPAANAPPPVKIE